MTIANEKLYITEIEQGHFRISTHVFAWAKQKEECRGYHVGNCKIAIFMGRMRCISYILDHGDRDGFDSAKRRVFLGVSSELLLQTEVNLALMS